MKLVRFGKPGAEKPGAIGLDGGIRDLSGMFSDIAGSTLLPESLAGLKKLDLTKLPLVEDSPRFGACVGPLVNSSASGSTTQTMLRSRAWPSLLSQWSS